MNLTTLHIACLNISSFFSELCGTIAFSIFTLLFIADFLGNYSDFSLPLVFLGFYFVCKLAIYENRNQVKELKNNL